MMNGLSIKRLRCEQASSLIELALALPFLLFLILGVIDLGYGFRTYSALTSAAQEGARWLTTHPTDSTGAQARVEAEAAEVGIQASAITVSVSPLKSSYQAGDTLTVTVVHNYTLMFGSFTAIPTIPLNIQVTMRVLYG